MGQYALQESRLPQQHAPALELIRGGKSGQAATLAAPSKLATDIYLLGLALAALQIIDGILTALGVFQYGTSMEGNLLLRSLMDVCGCIPALILVKGGCIALVALLCQHAKTVTWLRPAFYGVIAIYLGMAVIPWTYIIVSDYLA